LGILHLSEKDIAAHFTTVVISTWGWYKCDWLVDWTYCNCEQVNLVDCVKLFLLRWT